MIGAKCAFSGHIHAQHVMSGWIPEVPEKSFFDANCQLIKMQAGGKFRQDDLEIIENSAINRDRFAHLMKELFANFLLSEEITIFPIIIALNS